MKRHLLLLALSALLAPFAPAAPSSTAIDPKALETLQRMSATLAAAPAFTFQAKSIFEVPAPTGQFLTFYSNSQVALQRPNKLRALLGGEAPHFDFYYDGTSVSAYAPGTKVYSQTPAPGTLDAMLAGLRTETGIRFPSAPLFFSNPYSILTRGLFSGIDVGSSRVDGAICEHLAFRSPGVNWEIWIQSVPSVPRRMAVTFTDQPNFPRAIVEFSNWNLRPWLSAGNFTFSVPTGAKEIPFNSVLKSADR